MLALRSHDNNFVKVIKTIAGVDRKMSVVSDTYSKALFKAAKSQGLLEIVADDVKSLTKLLVESPSIFKTFSNKSIEIKDLIASVDVIVKQESISKVTGNFLKTLIMSRKFPYIWEIFKNFSNLVLTENQEIVVDITSAQTLEKKHSQEIVKILKQQIGRTVILHERVDPEMLGGLIVQVGSEIYDASIRTQISEIKIGLERLES